MRWPSAREIAEHHDLPLELLAKVLQQLVRKGIVRSVQGINGGYCLSRSPVDTSVADIVEAIDGPLMLTACADEHEACDQSQQVQHQGSAAPHPGTDCECTGGVFSRRSCGGSETERAGGCAGPALDHAWRQFPRACVNRRADHG